MTVSTKCYKDIIDPKLMKRVSHTIVDYGFIQDADRIAVAVSGGKDSFLMLYILKELSQYAPVNFEIHAIHLDQHQPGFDKEALQKQLDFVQVPHTVLSYDTYSVVMEKTLPGQSTCFMCSRLRRGHLYAFCKQKGFNKLALGHHLEDSLETFLMNSLTKGKLRAIDPMMLPDDPANPIVIRPLIFVDEALIMREVQKFPISTIHCPVCDEQPDLVRPKMRALLEKISNDWPTAKSSLRGAIERSLYGKNDQESKS